MTGSSTAQKTLRATWSLFSALLLLMLGNGLVGVLVGVRSELEGFPTTVTGLIMAAYFGGFLLGSQTSTRLLHRVGHVRVFAGLASLVSASALAYALWVSPIPWMVLRFTVGFGMAGLYVVVENWLNESVANDTRGRMMAVYMVVSMGGLGLGQLLLGAGDPLEKTMFLVAGAIVALAVVPVSLTVVTAPPPVDYRQASVGDVWRMAPVGVITAVGTGIANGTMIGLGGVYATQLGFDPARTGLFVAAAALGTVLLQYPIGMMSDTVGRRQAISLATIGATTMALAGVIAPKEGMLLIAIVFVLGGLSFTMYSLASTHVVDVLPPGERVAGSVAVVFFTGVGAVIGPVYGALAMSSLGSEGYFWGIAAVHALIGAFTLYRMAIRPDLAKSPLRYIPLPARSTFVPSRFRSADDDS